MGRRRLGLGSPFEPGVTLEGRSPARLPSTGHAQRRSGAQSSSKGSGLALDPGRRRFEGERGCRRRAPPRASRAVLGGASGPFAFPRAGFP